MKTRWPDPGLVLERIAESRVGLAIVLAVGVAVRLMAVRQARFDRDEALSWATALDLAQGRAFPMLGPGISDSDAATPGPLFFYLMALPQLVTADPMAGSLFTASLNLLALLAVFDAMRQAWSLRAGAVFLILMIASPWTVSYGDRVWSANLLIPLSAAAIWSLTRVVQRRQSRAVALLSFVVLTGAQVHVLCLHLWPLALVPLILYRPRLNARWLAGGVAAGLMAYAPYVRAELAGGFANTRLLVTQAPGVDRSLRGLAGLVLDFLALATTDVSFLVAQGWWRGFDPLAFWAGDGFTRTRLFYASAGIAPLLWGFWLAGWLLVAGGILLGVRALRSGLRPHLRSNLFFLLYGIAAASLVALYLVTGRSGFAHYAIVLAPLAPVPAIAALLRLLELGRAGLAVVYLLGVPLAGWLSLRPHYLLDSRQSIPQQQGIVTFIHERTAGGPFQLDLAFPEGKGVTYLLLARRARQLPWLVTPRGREVFTVFVRGGSPPLVEGRVASTKTLDTLAVIHSRR